MPDFKSDCQNLYQYLPSLYAEPTNPVNVEPRKRFIPPFCEHLPKWGLYGVAEQKGVWRTVLYNGFRFVLGYRDWPTLNTQWRRLS